MKKSQLSAIKNILRKLTVFIKPDQVKTKYAAYLVELKSHRDNSSDKLIAEAKKELDVVWDNKNANFWLGGHEKAHKKYIGILTKQNERISKLKALRKDFEEIAIKTMEQK